MTPTAPTLGATLIALMPVVVGGTIALVGAVITSILNHVFKGKSERKERQRKKLEELVGLAYEAEAWLEKLAQYQMFKGEDIVNEVSPIQRLCAICDLYFPDMKSVVDDWREATITYRLWVQVGVNERLETGTVSNQHRDKHLDVYGSLRVKSNMLVKRAVEEMRRIE